MADLSAAGGMVIASIGPESESAHTLYVSADDGRSWVPLPAPLHMKASLQSIALSGDARRFAGTDLDQLFVLRGLILNKSSLTWVSHPVHNLFALAFDPTNSDRLVGLGGDIGPRAHTSLVYLSDDGGATLRVQSLPLPIGYGQALVVVKGMAILALGQPFEFESAARLPVRVFEISLTAGTAPDLPQPPFVAGSPTYALTADQEGTLYLITQGGLFMLKPHSAAWQQRSLPPGTLRTTGLHRQIYLAANGRQLYLAAEDADGAGTLWRTDTTGGDWQALSMPEHVGYIGQPVPDGNRVWVPTTAGPVLVGSDGSAEVRTSGIATPVSNVASAAWRPTRVAASWSETLFLSDDGGQSWANRTPPHRATSDISDIRWTVDGSCIAVTAVDIDYQAGAGRAHPQFFFSDDLGHMWWHLPAPNGGSVFAVMEAPTGSGIWWATPGPYRSAPGRSVWTRIDLPPEAEGPEAVQAFAFLTQLAAASDGVWLGDSYGIWRLRLPSMPAHSITHEWGAGNSYYGLVSNPYDASVVYSGTRRTFDGGRTWGLALPGPADVTPGKGFREKRVAFGPDQPGAVLAIGTDLIRDDGRMWVPFWSAPTKDQSVWAIAPAGPRRFYAVVQKLGVVVIEDTRTHWRAPVLLPYVGHWTVPPREPGRAWAFEETVEATAPSNRQIVYRLRADGKLDESHDGGRSFSPLPAVALSDSESCCWLGPGPVTLVSALAISPADPNRLYVGRTLNGAAAYQPEFGLWISDNGGRNWHRSGLREPFSVEGIAIVSGSSDTVYVVAGRQLMRSSDGGRSWAPIKTPLEEVYSVATPTADEVMVGGDEEIWRSTDRGQTFTRVHLGIPTWGEPEPGAVTPSNPVTAIMETPGGTLFAGSGLGVAQSRDGGRTWQVVSEPVGDPPVRPDGLNLRADSSIAVATQYGTFVYWPARYR